MTMRWKILAALIVLFLLGFVTGCAMTTTAAMTTETTTETTTVFSYTLIDGEFALVEGVRLYGDLDVLRFDKLTFDDNLNDFMCVISSITFDALLRRLEVNVAVSDSNWRGFTYVAEIQPTEIEGMRMQYTFTKTSTSSVHKFVYDEFTGDGNYRFLIGKTTGTGVSGMSAMAVIGFDLDISGMDSRKQVSGYSAVIDSDAGSPWENRDTSFGRTEVQATIAFRDPDVAVSAVRVQIRDAENESVIMEVQLDPAWLRDGDGVVWIEEAMFDGLFPGAEYILTVLIDGNDGVRDFTDRVLLDKTFSTEPFGDAVFEGLGAFAHVNTGSVGATGYDFDLLFEYDGVSPILDFVHPIPFVLRVRDIVGGSIRYEAALDSPGIIPFTIPNEAMGVDTLISVESADGRLVLCRSGIFFREPEIRAVIGGTAGHRTLTIDWWNYDGEITAGTIEIRDYLTNAVLHEIPFSAWGSGHAFLNLGNIPQSATMIIVLIKYEYDAFGGFDHVIADDGGQYPL